NVLNLLGQIFYSLRGVAVGTDAKRICGVDFEQIGGLVENGGDGFVVHELRLNKIGKSRQREYQCLRRDKSFAFCSSRQEAKIRNAGMGGLRALGNVGGLRSFSAVGDFEFDRIALLQALVTLG